MNQIINENMYDFNVEMEGVDSLRSSGYVQDKNVLDRLKAENKKDFLSRVLLWTQEFRMTSDEMNYVMRNNLKLFDGREINTHKPEEEVSFWIRNAVGNRPNLKTDVWSEDGRKFEVSVKKAVEFKELDDKNKATLDQIMSAMMVTLAKIEAIRPIMTDVYPGLETETIGLVKKEIEGILLVLTGELKPEEKSFSSINFSSKYYKKFIWATLSVSLITTYLLSGCADVAFAKDGSVATMPNEVALINSPLELSSDYKDSESTKLTDAEAIVLRNKKILMAADRLEKNPEMWLEAPDSCRKSMVRFWIYDQETNDGDVGSASVVEGKRVVDSSGKIAWIYSFITADHVVRGVDGSIMNGEVLLFPGSYDKQDLRFFYLDYTQFTDDSGKVKDSGIMTVIGFGDRSEIKNVNFKPLGVDKIRGFNEQDKKQVLFTLDYPGITGKPQFVKSRYVGDIGYPDGGIRKILDPVKDSSTVAMGSSGAAECTSGGSLVGVASGYEGFWESKFTIEPNSSSVNRQVINAQKKALLALSKFGFSQPLKTQ